ncbi:pyrroline-5-carboxylate reductase [Dacryopinax primogenitus]|uniref:Pyrroline-5-carboxylate reductase n=1 Tax=Dacryopinax primogenitus (strain DJM 731) TaxID=1858805 RepID=M5GB85_DACPD|nr:pyrroline-5-carboxylate reductase [Dacryopinax primogenitus]EJU05655.1 pyrroline-5-carboxylate reductase [Dacryopinax primogenitus]
MGYTLCVIGCGTMGIAILSGVVDVLKSPSPFPNGMSQSSPSGISTPVPTLATVPDESLPSKFTACVSRDDSVRRLKRTFEALGGLGPAIQVIAGHNADSAAHADIIILCCKPHQAEGILTAPGMVHALEGKLLISILAGVTISQMRGWVPASTRLIRAMPNTPCKIREGMTVLSSPDAELHTPLHLLAKDKEICTSIFSSIGRARFLDEKHFDACTALSGSGPAFACIFLEALADGGVMMGLPRAEALELAAQTLQGAARMTLQSGAHPAAIKDTVTTPGGCTIAGVLTLEDGRVRSTIARAIQVATERASELGQSGKQPTSARKH